MKIIEMLKHDISRKDHADTAVLILCAGSGERWGNHLGIPKQLIRFSGETLLHRMVRLLKENGVSNVICVARDCRLKLEEIPSLEPEHCAYTVETLLSTSQLWARRTIVLLGDVYFTQHAIRKIIAFDGNLGVFGRPWPSAYSHSNHGEIFGMSFDSSTAKEVECAANAARNLAIKGERGNLWDFYHCFTGLPLNSGRVESKFFHPIDDLTNDFDTPGYYEKVAVRYHLASSKRIIDKALLAACLVSLAPMHWIGRLTKRSKARKT